MGREGVGRGGYPSVKALAACLGGIDGEHCGRIQALAAGQAPHCIKCPKPVPEHACYNGAKMWVYSLGFADIFRV